MTIDPPCADGEMCVEDAQMCVPAECGDDHDADDDGHDAVACGGDDCDDADADRYPGNPEVCDASHDEDCDASTVGATDADADSFVSSACCNGETCGPDCDDALADVRPDVAETCNGRDDNCDGAMDEPGGELPLCPGGLCTAGACRLNAWAHTFGGPTIDRAVAVTMDAAGNSYIGGVFSDTATFDSGDLTAELGPVNQVVVSYAGDGTHRWDHHIVTADADYRMKLAVDTTGSSLFVLSSSYDQLDLGDGMPVTQSGRFMYLAELSTATGEVQRKTVLDTGNDAVAAGIVVTETSVLIAGFSDAPAIGGVPIDGGFMVEFDRNLSGMAVRPLPGITSVGSFASRPGGGYALVGGARDEFDLGCGATDGEAGQESFFVASFDSSGSCDWVYDKQFRVRDNDLVIHADGRVFLTGGYESPIDFGGGLRAPTPGAVNGFIIGIDSTGSYLWDRVFSSPAFAELYAIEVRGGSVIAAGTFRDTLRIGGSSVVGSPDPYDENAVIVQLSLEGALQPVQTFAAEGRSEATDLVVGVGGSTVLVGFWSGRISIGRTTFASTESTSGIAWPDAYIVRPSSI